MASRQELQVQQKREVEKKEEATIPARVFLPTADIYAGMMNSTTATTLATSMRCCIRHRRSTIPRTWSATPI
jgi:hypothetical protein